MSVVDHFIFICGLFYVCWTTSGSNKHNFNELPLKSRNSPDFILQHLDAFYTFWEEQHRNSPVNCFDQMKSCPRTCAINLVCAKQFLEAQWQLMECFPKNEVVLKMLNRITFWMVKLAKNSSRFPCQKLLSE